MGFIHYIAFICFISVTIILANNEFHNNLSKEHLVHYFGTDDPEKVPTYEFVSPTKTKPEGSEEDGGQYNFTAFGQMYQIQLLRNQHIIAPGCLLMGYYGNGTRSLGSCLGDQYHCYFHGYSLDHNQSSVAVSTCNGLHGIVSVPEHDLYIQPIKIEHQSRVRRHTALSFSHLVYKTNFRQKNSGEATSESEFIGQKRHKRSGQSYFAELRVVAAPDTVDFHGGNTKDFIITVINIAAARYKEPSLGVDMNLAIVEIILLQNDDPELEVTSDSQQMIKNFCVWQERRQPSNSNSARYADGALFITRQNLHYGNDYSNVGLGDQGGMCQSNLRCSVNQDKGLDLGLTITHELGHLLDMQHDGDTSNGCPNQGHIMSPDGGSGPSSLTWSSCSRDYIKHFLSSQRSRCLTDRPAGSALSSVHFSQKPGALFTATEQCQLAMGTDNTDICENTTLTTGDECKRLVCFNGNGRQCAGVGAVRLDGTECDPSGRKWCIGGRCVSMNARDPRPVNGGWSSWETQWSECTRTCGGGLKIKRRNCDNPSPRYGGSKCSGDSHQAELCNMEPCPDKAVSHREEQCSATNNIPYSHNTYSWLPYENNQCQLKCFASSINIMMIRPPKTYHDGTDCSVTANYGQIAKCLDGKCETFGCDGVKGHNVQLDNCGECGGNGRSCQRHSGHYNEGKAKEYVTFLTVPRGSTTIRATNRNVWCKMTVKINGQRLFNDDAKVSLSNIFTKGNLIVKYTQLHHKTLVPEAIFIQGPTTTQVELQVYRNYDDNYVGVRPEIDWSYYTPSKNNIYTWKTFASTCSQSCGTGYMIPRVLCVQTSDNSIVDAKKCNIYVKPSETRVDCNTRACPPEWFSYGWSGCSKSCGTGTKTREVACVIIQRDTKTKTADNRCNLRAKPVSSSHCNTSPCGGQWHTGSWSQCSTTCGRGVKTRPVTCHHTDGSLSADGCHQASKPATSEACLSQPCDFTTKGDDCADKVDCNNYEQGVCQKYKSWATTNCQHFCGFCVKDPSLYLCRDKISDCADYGTSVCTNAAYKNWVQSHCARSCGVCDNDAPVQPTQRTTTLETAPPPSCHDKVNCFFYAADICTNPHYTRWAMENCKMHCGFCHGPNNHQITTTANPQSNTCSDRVHCNDYAADICTNKKYQAWAMKNCQRHCNLCSGTTTRTIQTDGDCKDNVECDQYASDVCTNSRYKHWANLNCKKFCGFCMECRDLVKCSDYGADVCTKAKFSSWAHTNCPKHCGFCTGHAQVTTTTTTTTTTTPTTTTTAAQSSCSDKVDCSNYQSDVCTNQHYSNWAHKNCAKFCKFCTVEVADACADKVNCNDYAKDVCTSYKSWATKNCARTCGICKPCEDVIDNCKNYAADMCTSYRPWAEKNCRKHCNLCGNSRKKRTVDEAEELLPVPLQKPVEEELPLLISMLHKLDEDENDKDNEDGPTPIKQETPIIVPSSRDDDEVHEPVRVEERPELLEREIVADAEDEQPALMEEFQPEQPLQPITEMDSPEPDVEYETSDLEYSNGFPPEEGGPIVEIVPVPDDNTDVVLLPPPEKSEVRHEVIDPNGDNLTAELDQLLSKNKK